MKILINDFPETHQNYRDLFEKYGYESNELIFSTSYENAIGFIANHLEKQKGHLDLIITNNDRLRNADIFKADSLLSFIRNNHLSFSKYNFRISSMPVILYSTNETKEFDLHGFDSIVKKNISGNHNHFFNECERVIKEWRNLIYSDLDKLGIKMKDLKNFIDSDYYKRNYSNNISKNAESYFHNKIEILSLEFIRLPSTLNYDWFILNPTEIELSISKFIDTYNKHQKYDRQNGERTILHDFFRQNRTILLRDTYSDMKYELNLDEIDTRNSEECDFILKTEYPDFLNTTFFEVKKEDVTFYVKKNTKRPQMSSAFLSHLKQVWGYKEFTQNPINQLELTSKLEYNTTNFDFVLLAGRKDEKDEMNYLFEKEIDRMFNGINVITYEELENINIEYLNRFNRLNF
jgi:hypothetical protein